MGKQYYADALERKIYHVIAGSEGIKARDIAKAVGAERNTVNRYLYGAPFMKELCVVDSSFLWHGLIRQSRPHVGLGMFSGWYGTAAEFLRETGEEWFQNLCGGCERIGRNLNDTRGLFHSFRDCRRVMTELFSALEEIGFSSYRDWELAFELRLNRGKYIRIYADVLLITENRVFPLEFKMKDRILPGEVSQAAKYCPYLETVFGPRYDVVPALVLTRAADLYTYAPLPGTEAELPVCSGDMLFNLLDEYMNLLKP